MMIMQPGDTCRVNTSIIESCSSRNLLANCQSPAGSAGSADRDPRRGRPAPRIADTAIPSGTARDDVDASPLHGECSGFYRVLSVRSSGMHSRKAVVHCADSHVGCGANYHASRPNDFQRCSTGYSGGNTSSNLFSARFRRADDLYRAVGRLAQ